MTGPAAPAAPTAFGTGTMTLPPTPDVVEQLHAAANADYRQARDQQAEAVQAAINARLHAVEAARAWRNEGLR